MRLDARIPIRSIHPAPDACADRRWADHALLLAVSHATGSPSGWLAVLHIPPVEIDATRPGHQPGCQCCRPRSEAAVMLTRLVQDRARGEIGFFRGVVASLPQDEAARLRTLIESDPYLNSCFANVDG